MNLPKECSSIDSLKGTAILGIILVHSGCSFRGGGGEDYLTCLLIMGHAAFS